MSQPRILAFAGSARRDSFNKKLAAAAAAVARNAGAEVTVVDFAELPMPLYDQDLEAEKGMPANAQKFKDLLLEHQGLILACPEYNSSITPLLKNAIDWGSRGRAENEPPLAAYRGKVAALLAASPGKMGGLRGLVHVRSILQNIGVMVIPSQLAVSEAYKAFAEDGSLADDGTGGRLKKIVHELVDTTRKLHG